MASASNKIDYTPRNTRQRGDQIIVQHGRVVCESNPHNWVRKGSNFTAKGGQPGPANPSL